jgi:hypothetical protein
VWQHGAAQALATCGRFQDDSAAINASRLRASGAITADAASGSFAQRDAALRREVHVMRKKFPNLGLWVLCLCRPAAGACASSGCTKRSWAGHAAFAAGADTVYRLIEETIEEAQQILRWRPQERRKAAEASKLRRF